ncbi:AAA domain-containing protein [Tribonema minus]|uniref:AAA domain-containing protein n=1 Tax=Tribonema minus TaxID=303371 RepID=A0A835ZCE9_9STRA|nr:AAA domain-containing protein [Tribonema minus]
MPGQPRALMVVATKQHVGKTSMCMALMSACRQRFGKGNVGFIKPVGQRWVETKEGARIDQDANLARLHFGLSDPPQNLSPVIISQGYTKAYVEGRVDSRAQWERIRRGFEAVVDSHEFTIVEGTGHVGVGSVVGLSNAEVARRLGIPVVLIGTGGLGSTYDELALNKQLCDNLGVRVSGVIVNKVRTSKLPMVQHYMSLACQQLGAPLLGIVPHTAGFDSPSCADLEHLFGEKMLSRRDAALRRFNRYELVTTSLRRFMEKINREPPEQLGRTCFITHASRVDLIMGLHTHVMNTARADRFECGLILSGGVQLPASVCNYLSRSKFPVLKSRETTAETMRKIAGYTAKMDPSDPGTVDALISQVAPHIDLELMLREVRKGSTTHVAHEPLLDAAVAAS